MFATEMDHFKVLSENLNGSREIDEQTFSAVAVLAERMDRLKRSNPLFEQISFSPEIEELACSDALSEIC